MDESWRPILELFKIIPASPEVVTAFIVLLGFMVFITVGVQVVIYLIKRRKMILERWEWFYRMCEAKDLSEEEMKLLRDMIKRCKIKKPAGIFKSINLFDKCVNLEFKRLSNSEIEMEEFADDISEIRQKLHFDRFPTGEILNSTRGIPFNQRVRIEVEVEGRKRHFRTKVLGVKEDSIVILMPKHEKFREVCSVGQAIEVYFWRSGDAGYTFSTVITNVVYEEPEIFYIEHSDKIERTQRRLYYRIDISLPLYFIPLSPEQRAEIRENRHIKFAKDVKPVKGRIASLSGGGLSFVSDTTLPNGKMLWFEINLYGSEPISDVYGRVVRSKKLPENKFKLYIDFALIPEKEREIIIGFVAAKQRERVRL